MAENDRTLEADYDLVMNGPRYFEDFKPRSVDGRGPSEAFADGTETLQNEMRVDNYEFEFYELPTLKRIGRRALAEFIDE